MRWMVLSLVLINVMILAWRYIDQRHVVESGSALGGSDHHGVAAAPSSGAIDGSAQAAISAPSSDLEAQTITLLEELESDRVALRTPSSSSVASEHVSVVQDESELLNDTQAALMREPSALADEVEDLCYWVGPIPNKEDRDELRARLLEFKIAAQEKAVDVSGGWRYWVYLAPKETRAEAASQLAVLKKMGVDSYLILKGERKHGVSLGLFSRKVLADAKMAKMQKKGWQPKMDSFERMVKQWSLVIKKDDLDRVGDGVLPILLKNKTEMKINENKCK
ncbi:SPOR domain-containing protein [Marinagarivorans algicola]|uniref:SPOR domain-containing protein n=1 Tax=Marinagarivorans algicola TaxID=1513270 RepID=UPI00138F169A|nr:SPOR domain-containing protein [Marinagarivorans algicola]